MVFLKVPNMKSLIVMTIFSISGLKSYVYFSSEIDAIQMIIESSPIHILLKENKAMVLGY